MDLFRLDGKRALVTGGSKGIGLGIAKGFAGAGADLILVARSEGDLDDAAAAVRDHTEVVTSAFDLTNADGIGDWYEDLIATHGPVDILVNDAGIVEHGPAEQMSLSDFTRVLQVNVVAVFALCQAFARERIRSGSPGRIINISSVAGIEVAPFPASPYPASKGAVIQMTKDLANEWASKGILVNALAPGWIDTPMCAALVKDEHFSGWLTKRVPLGRWGQPSDMVGPALLLASQAGGFLTGSVLVADGGLIATTGGPG
ncbi:MAG TPA: SDR family oxidoreductase [Actinomycetota bacterium]|nr:SDR family oxidoreductase [Actinomycetota bacterium]